MSLKIRWLPLLTLMAAGAAGCDDGPTGPSGTAFDPQSTDETVQTLHAELNADGDVLTSLTLAGAALAEQGVASIVLPRDLAEPVAPLAAQMIQASGTSGSAAVEPAFPVELYGTVFEWSVDLGNYALASPTGAPEKTVRFKMYAVNPVTGQPVVPLVEVGYIDITDLGTDVMTGVRVYAAADELSDPWVDYTILATYSLAGADITLTIGADGFISDGSEILRFDMSETATFLTASEIITIDVRYSVWLDGYPATVTVGLYTELDTASATPVETADLSLVITEGSERVELLVTLAVDNTLSGVLLYNGAPALTVSGTEGDPVFTRVDDQPLTTADVAALLAMYDLAEDVLDLAEALFRPFSGASV